MTANLSPGFSKGSYPIKGKLSHPSLNNSDESKILDFQIIFEEG